MCGFYRFSCLQDITFPLHLFIQLMFVHNASVTEDDLSAPRPWWALCFDPQTPNSLQLSLHSFLSLCMSLPPLLQRLSTSLITAFLSVSHKPNILSTSASPTTSARSRLLSLPPSLHLSLFALALVSQPHSQVHVSIMWGSSAHSCCSISLSYWPVSHFSLSVLQSLWLSLHWHGENICLKNLLHSGHSDYEPVFRWTVIAFSQTDTDNTSSCFIKCAMNCAHFLVN